MSTDRRRADTTIHVLDVTLKYVEPTVTRRIAVPSDATLGTLSRILETCVGWDGSHLHVFDVRGTRYSDPFVGFEEMENEDEVTLSDVLHRSRMKMHWEYDLGDRWEHDIVVASITAREPNVKYPICLDGEGVCPPEDCGGYGSYDNLRQILSDPAHHEYEEMKEWSGGFDPDARFDADAVNARLISR